MTPGDITRLDREHVWHPYSPLPAPVDSLPVVSAQGVRLRLADGRELIDGMSSWWCAIHGYRHPTLDAAVSAQLERMAHVMFGGLTHEPAVRLARRLVQLAPAGLERVFFADSGSVAVEVAIKMALQCQRARGHARRTRLLTVRGGYHGDTFGAMAVCDPVGGMHSLFRGVLAQHVFADRPPDGFQEPHVRPGEHGGLGQHERLGEHGRPGEHRRLGERRRPGQDARPDERARELERWATHVRELAARHADELAGVIVEPVVQGAGGMRFHSPACVRVLREVCDELGLLLILDEIATGFGRTGTLFACEHAGVSPDVMCVGKALTGGYMTLAATLCTPAVAEAVSGGEGGALMHGPTYMASPLACAVALASLDLLAEPARASNGGRDDGARRVGDVRDGGWRQDVARIECGLRQGLAPAHALAGVKDVRVLGAIGVVQLTHDVDVVAATAAAVECGVWLRPFRDLVYTMPPYVIGDEELAAVSAAVVEAASA